MSELAPLKSIDSAPAGPQTEIESELMVVDFVQIGVYFPIPVDFGLFGVDDLNKWTGNIRSANKPRRIPGLFAFMGSTQVLLLQFLRSHRAQTWFPRHRKPDSLALASSAFFRSVWRLGLLIEYAEREDENRIGFVH